MNKDRIIFLDLMRAIAVIMMIQGHTLDTFLADEYRTLDSLLYSIWYSMRGISAPIFMFIAGVVFTYLLQSRKLSFKNNPRIKKGFKRFFLLVGIGYLLRYPTHKIIEFSHVTPEKWLCFYCVDALHLIGFGLLFIIVFLFVSERLNIRFSLTLFLGALFFLILTPIFYGINWENYFPLPIASYFYKGTGSLFPLFPWISYVLIGAIFGNKLAGNHESVKSGKLGITWLTYGVMFVGFAYAVESINKLNFQSSIFSDEIVLIFIYRLGFVLILSGIVSYLSKKLNTIPSLFLKFGRNSLVIYVAHLILLYGFFWFPGLNRYLGRSMNIWESLGAVAIMFSFSIFIIHMVEKNKFFRKKKKLVLQT